MHFQIIERCTCGAEFNISISAWLVRRINLEEFGLEDWEARHAECAKKATDA